MDRLEELLKLMKME